MVQPLVENAVKHAFKKNAKDQKGSIEVKYFQRNNEVIEN